MIGESQLNVYIVGGDRLEARVRERIQAQVQSTLRAIPQWVFTLLRLRLVRLGLSSFPFIIEPQSEGEAGAKALSVGRLGQRPAVSLLPIVQGEAIDWRQERKHLVAKALGYLCMPQREEDDRFWRRWSQAMERDGLASLAQQADERWQGASALDLLLEMFAAYVLKPEHPRWQELPWARRFLARWKATVTG